MAVFELVCWWISYVNVKIIRKIVSYPVIGHRTLVLLPCNLFTITIVYVRA